MSQAAFGLHGRNPDVLTCIANLSNDEVFTPPDLANQMLDAVEEAWAANNSGESIWKNSSLVYLDPFTKSGVFLREITKRLVAGLAEEIPDLSKRVDHILTRQVFGIAITELTGLLARRSLYCSKWANGKHSIAKSLNASSGNIWFERTDHTWVAGKCRYCGVSQVEYTRDADLETHAYAFIHTDDIKARLDELFGGEMQFDVVIGNPPYHLDTGGSGRQARPIYNLFVDQAKELQPRYLSMVIQSRWFGGGMGLNDFRASMLEDRRLSKLVDYTDSNEVFPGTDFGGGVCYFLWDSAHDGPCEVENHHAGSTQSSVRDLNEFEYFIRHSLAIPIIRKVIHSKENSLRSEVSAVRPFGIATKIRPSAKGAYTLVSSGGEGRVAKSLVTARHDLVNVWKVLLSKTSHDHAGLPDKDGTRRVFSRLRVIGPKTVCTESYIVIGNFPSEKEAENCRSYLATRFVRFLVSQLSYSQDITSPRFEFVPTQDFSRSWNDTALYEKYGITKDEIDFIERLVRPMELTDG